MPVLIAALDGMGLRGGRWNDPEQVPFETSRRGAGSP